MFVHDTRRDVSVSLVFTFIRTCANACFFTRLLMQDTASLGSQKGGVSKHGWLYKGNMNSAISVTMRVGTKTQLKATQGFTTHSNALGQ